MTLLDCVSLHFSEVSFAIRGLGSSPEATAPEDLAGVIFHSACPMEPDASLQLWDVSFSIFSRGFEECFTNNWPSIQKKKKKSHLVYLCSKIFTTTGHVKI